MKTAEKERAKALISEIIRQAGGTLRNTTNLYKIFWYAHVVAAKHGHTLSTYPIVKMPKGPGIDRFETLKTELENTGVISGAQVVTGNCTGMVYTLNDASAFRDSISESDSRAIAEALEVFLNLGAEQASQKAYSLSRALRSTADGKLLDIDLDAISDEEYEKIKERMRRRRSMIDAALAR